MAMAPTGWFDTLGDILGLGSSLYGGYQAYRGAGTAADAQRAALAGARTQLNPFSVSGLGGAGASYTGGNVGMTGGPQLDALSQALRGYAGGAVPSTPGAMPAGFDFGFQGLDRLSGQAGTVGDRSYQQLLQSMQQGFQRPLQNTSFLGAGRQLQDVSMGGMDARAQQLDLLRRQAQPFEDRQFGQLQQNLFSTGRLGSTGGGLQTEAFARGLGQADLDRQLAAAGEGRAFQQNAMGLAQGMSGLGLGLSQQENEILSSAFGRFQQTSQLGADLNRERFSRSMYSQTLPLSLDAMRLGNTRQALGAQGDIQSQLLNLFGTGLSAEQAAAQARIGSANAVGNIATSPAFGVPQQQQASVWSQLGQALMGGPGGAGNNVRDVLGRLFGGSGAGSTGAADLAAAGAADVSGTSAWAGSELGGMAMPTLPTGASAAGFTPAGSVSIADAAGNIIPSVAAGSSPMLSSLFGGMQPGIQAGIGATQAAGAAELAGMAAPTLGGTSTGALGGAAGADAAAGGAGSGALAAAAPIAALGALIYGFANVFGNIGDSRQEKILTKGYEALQNGIAGIKWVPQVSSPRPNPYALPGQGNQSTQVSPIKVVLPNGRVVTHPAEIRALALAAGEGKTDVLNALMAAGGGG